MNKSNPIKSKIPVKVVYLISVFVVGFLFQRILFSYPMVSRKLINSYYNAKQLNSKKSFSVKSSDAKKLNYIWVKVTDDSTIPPRDGAAAVVHDGQMYLIGGWNAYEAERFPRKTVNDVWRSNDGKTWVQVKSNSFSSSFSSLNNDWEGRHCFGCFSFLGYIYIICGDLNQGYYQDDIWRSKDGNRWEKVIAGAELDWRPRHNFMMAVAQDKMFVIGGQTSQNFYSASSNNQHTSTAFHSDVWSTVDGRKWVKVKNLGETWNPRGMVLGNCIFNNRIILVGGSIGISDIPWLDCNGKSFLFQDTVFESQPLDRIISDGGLVFVKKPQKVPLKLGWTFAQEFDSKFWLVGGFDEDLKDQSKIIFSKDLQSWTQLSDCPFPPAHAMSVFNYNDSLIFLCGSSLTTEVWQLEKASATAPLLSP